MAQDPGETVRDPTPRWNRELLASLVVFLVALPLCVGISVASGVPVTAGILSAVIGGVVVGAFSGSPLLVSGPAAALAVMVFEFVQRFGLEALGPIVFLAGGFQLLWGRLGLGSWFRAVAPPVLHGLLGGIGIMVMASQCRIALGLLPTGNAFQDLLSLPGLALGVLTGGLDGNALQAASLLALTLTVVVMAGTLCLPVPPYLVGVVAGTAVAHQLAPELPRLQIPQDLWSEIRWFHQVDLSLLLAPEILFAALALALVASAETLLCASALDQLHDGKDTEYDQELTAQGIGNLLCGLVGALPSVGLIVRSTANIEYGARTRAPAMLHGVWILLVVLLAPWLLGLIPVAALAALLVHVGYSLAAKVPLKRIQSYGRSEVAIYLATLGAILSLGLLRGVGLGVALSLLKLLHAFSHLEIRHETREGSVHLHLEGAATFLVIPRLTRFLDQVQGAPRVHLHAESLDYVDHACLELLGNWQAQCESRGQRVRIQWSNLAQKYQDRNRRLDTHQSLEPLLRTRGMERPELFDEVGTRADFERLPADTSYEEALERATRRMARSLGRDRDELLEAFRRGSGATIVLQGVALPHCRLPGLERPHMALFPCETPLVVPGGETVTTLVFLVSPAQDAALHLHILARVAEQVEAPEFSSRWQGAESELALKETLLRPDNFVSLDVPAWDPETTPGALPPGAARFHPGRTVSSLSLPEDCQAALVTRQQASFVPLPSTVLEAGDRLTILGGTASIHALRRSYT